jgi:hypothetical protein
MEDLLLEIRKEDNVTKIDEAVKRGRTILASYSQSRTDPLQAYLLSLFGDVNFERTMKIEYLNESISVHRQVIESPFPQAIRIMIFSLSYSILCSSAPGSSQTTAPKTWTKRWNYSPSVSTTHLTSCPIDF